MSENAASAFADRLRLVLGSESVNRFAKRAGIPEGSVRQYLTGSLPGIDKAAAIAEAGNVSLDWLISDRGPMHIGGTVQGGVPEDFTLIPRLDIQASAGAGALVDVEDAYEVLAFRADWLRRRGINPATAHVLTARGDSMEPTIRDGDILLVDTSIENVLDNAIYVVVFAGLTLVKRLQMLRNGDVVIKSDNNQVFDDEHVPAAEVPSIRVAGRVMWYGRSI